MTDSWEVLIHETKEKTNCGVAVTEKLDMGSTKIFAHSQQRGLRSASVKDGSLLPLPLSDSPTLVSCRAMQHDNRQSSSDHQLFCEWL